MLHQQADGSISQLRRRAGRIRDVAAATRTPFVAHELEELALFYDDIAANTAAQGEAAFLTTADIRTDDLIDHLQKKAHRFLQQAWSASDRSLADQLRSLSASFDAEAVRLLSHLVI